MGTGISYCDEVLNVCVGCSPIKSGCKHCWAEKLHNQRHKAWFEGRWPDAPKQYHKPFSEIQLLPDRLKQPLHWRKPRTIFVNSMGDTLHKDVPATFINKMWSVMDNCPQHTFLVFTKRFKRARSLAWWPKNVRLYFSASTQKEVDEAVPILLQIPVAVRGLSLEPLLESVSISQWVYPNSCGCTEGDVTRKGDERFRCVHCRDSLAVCELDHIIVGCESGPKQRLCDIEDIWNIVHQCSESRTPVYVKQIPIDGKCVTLKPKTRAIWPAWARREMP